MPRTSCTPGGIAYDRDGPRGGDPPVVLVHAGVADRRMWDPQWLRLTREHDAVRLDLRGYGESSEPPHATLDHVDDVLATLAFLEIGRCHLVGASYGAGVAVDVAVTRPERVASLMLSAPGGSLIAEMTPDLRAFIDAERAALAQDDLDAAVEANLAWWVDGPHRGAGDVDPSVRAFVAQMQRRAFEVTAGWDDIDEAELDPPAFDRLDELTMPALVVLGELDLQAIQDTARRLAERIPGARLVRWADTAHLPSMERPDDFLALLLAWLASGD